jgi:hypothetical protein
MPKKVVEMKTALCCVVAKPSFSMAATTPPAK